MTTSTDPWPRWRRIVAIGIAALVIAGLTHVLSNKIHLRTVVMFVIATALVATAMYLMLRSIGLAAALVIGAATVYAGRAFLSSGLINLLDVGLLAADGLVAPFIATWLAAFVVTSAVTIAWEARRKVWLILLLTVIVAISIPTRYPDLA